MITGADVSALQATLNHRLAAGLLQPVWHAYDGHAAIALTALHRLEIWSGLLPLPVEAFGCRRALNHQRYSRILQGGVAELDFTVSASSMGSFVIAEGERVPDPEAQPYEARIWAARKFRRNTRDSAYGTPMGRFHERRVLEPFTVILAETGPCRPGPDQILAWRFPVSSRPEPVALPPMDGLLANAVRDALARLDDHAWHCLTAAIAAVPLLNLET